MDTLGIGQPVFWKTGEFLGDVMTGRILAFGQFPNRLVAVTTSGGLVVWLTEEELKAL